MLQQAVLRVLAPALLAACTIPERLEAQPGGLLRALDASAPITYFIADGRSGSEYLPADRELAEWALADWARASEGVLNFEAADEASAIVRVYWVPASSGQYGEMRPLVVDGRRGAAVFIRPDMSALGEDIAAGTADDALLRDTIVYLTCLHELGHALGLAHTDDFADVMYFFGFGGDIPRFFGRYRDRLESRGDIVMQTGLSAGDVEQLSTLYSLARRAPPAARREALNRATSDPGSPGGN